MIQKEFAENTHLPWPEPRRVFPSPNRLSLVPHNVVDALVVLGLDIEDLALGVIQQSLFDNPLTQPKIYYSSLQCPELILPRIVLRVFVISWLSISSDNHKLSHFTSSASNVFLH